MRLILFFTMTLLTTALVAQAAQQSRKHFWHTVETTASAEKIWAVWTDVEHWQDWDTGLKKAEMSMPFALKAKGKITSLEGRKSKFSIVAFEPGKSYTFKTNLPLGGLYVKRTLEVKAGKTQFTHEVWFSGLTGGLFAKKFGDKFKSMLPEVMGNVKRIAEK